ncbi:MAG: lysylphosphatidylglycerol synthase transmembrane domain-containing protein [Bryobacteraceae bacterium]
MMKSSAEHHTDPEFLTEGAVSPGAAHAGRVQPCSSAQGGSIPKKQLRWGVALLVAGLALVVWILFDRFREFRLEVFTATLASVDWRWLAAAAAFALLTYYGRVIRWAVLIRSVAPRASHWNIFTATAIGFTAVVLFGRPGEVVRPYLIARKESLPLTTQLAAWLLERIYDLLVVLLIFALGLARIHASGASVGPSLEWVLQTGGYIVGFVCTVCCGVLIALRQYSDKMHLRLVAALAFLPEPYFTKAQHMIGAFVRGVASTRCATSTVLLLLYTFLEWALIGGCYYSILQAFPETAGRSFTDVLIFLGFVSFGSIVQIPGVGGGMQIVAILVLTEIFRIPLETASGVALLIWLITFVVIVPIGLALAFHEGLNYKKIKHLEEEAASQL